MLSYFLYLAKTGWKLSGMISRAQWILRFLGVGASGIVGAAGAWAAGLPLLVQLFAMLLGLLVAGTFVLVYTGHDEWKRLQSLPFNFNCDYPTLARLVQLVPSVAEDALDHRWFSDDMNERLRQLEHERGVFLNSTFAADFRMFMQFAKALIGGKELGGNKGFVSSSPERTAFREHLNTHYALLKEALNHDYAQRRKEAR